MPKFFKPWPQQAGVMTLALALCFLGAWIRTCFVTDYVHFGRNAHLCAIIVSVRQVSQRAG